MISPSKALAKFATKEINSAFGYFILKMKVSSKLSAIITINSVSTKLIFRKGIRTKLAIGQVNIFIKKT